MNLSGGHPERHDGGRQAWRGAARLVAAVAVAALTSVLVQSAVLLLPLPYPSAVPKALLNVGGALVVIALATIALRYGTAHRAWPRWADPAVWAGLSGLTSAMLALPLHGTLFYLGGIGIDQQFRMQFFGRLADSPALADMNYAGLPSYYPAGWFWIGARAADLLGIPAWQAYKPYAVVSVAVTAALVFALWSTVVRPRLAVLVALAVTLTGLRMPDVSVGAVEPYCWLLAALLPPVMVHAWRTLRTRGRAPRPALIGVGLFLGLCGAVYTLYFGFVFFVLLVMGLLAAALAHRSGTSWRAALRTAAGRLAGMGLAALPLVLVIWGGYLVAAVAAGFPPQAAPRYLEPSRAMLPFPMLQFSVLGALSLAGTIWLVVRARQSHIAQALALCAGAVYVWFALSTLALAFETTLLAFRFNPALYVLLSCAGVFGLVDAVRHVGRVTSAERMRTATAAVVAVGILGGASLVQGTTKSWDDAVDDAYNTHYPSGVTAAGERDPQDDDAWNGELIETIDAFTTRPPGELVLLTDNYSVLGFAPYRSFQQSTIHYANPLADFDARRAEITRWTKAANPAELQRRLDAGRWQAPSVFVLRRAENGYAVHLTHDTFPLEQNVGGYDVVFPGKQFSSPDFSKRDVGPYTVIVRNGT
ncbi:arabinofuranosyltransferase [Qaidamihabitans albus]|uniref:arabinofuranosyltransferase n=1 Tax=Qaidamihabitans albus TaxID=2795733 RepID=UPI0018F278AB|nr:arabinofuranosyltransferase [Qaidamihabitans albus]